jgi:hypothetical protein
MTAPPPPPPDQSDLAAPPSTPPDLAVAAPDLARPPGDLASAPPVTDLANPPPPPDFSDQCDPVSQSGCLVGQKCTLGLAQLICVADGTQAAGTACSTLVDDCLAGSWCQPESSTVHACRQFCRVDGDCTQPAVGPTMNVAHCLVDVPATTTVKTCTIACDPVAATGCPSGLTCRYGQAPGVGVNEFTDCALIGSGGNGAACAASQDCAPGYVCLASQSLCRRVCHAGSPTDCNSVGGSCMAAAVPSPMFGVCL